MTVEVMIGRGRDAIDMVVDPGSFRENQVGDVTFPDDVGPGAVVGEATIDGRDVVVIANDAQAFNDKFPVVYFGVIGLEEAYKMAKVVYTTIKQDAEGMAAAIASVVKSNGEGTAMADAISAAAATNADMYTVADGIANKLFVAYAAYTK